MLCLTDVAQDFNEITGTQENTIHVVLSNGATYRIYTNNIDMYQTGAGKIFASFELCIADLIKTIQYAALSFRGPYYGNAIITP